MKALTWASNTSDYLASPYALTAASSNGILNLTAANFAGYTTSSIDISSAGTTATSLFPANEYLFLLPVSNATGTAVAGDVQVKIAYDMVNKCRYPHQILGGKDSEPACRCFQERHSPKIHFHGEPERHLLQRNYRRRLGNGKRHTRNRSITRCNETIVKR